MELSSIICAIAVTLCVSFVTYIACHKELSKSPAETLRNEVPNVKAKTLNITTKGLFKK